MGKVRLLLHGPQATHCSAAQLGRTGLLVNEPLRCYGAGRDGGSPLRWGQGMRQLRELVSGSGTLFRGAASQVIAPFAGQLHWFCSSWEKWV
jgi:hypothetical protein